MKTTVSILMILLCLSPLEAHDTIKVRKQSYYAGVHFAGNTGLFSVHAGCKFFNKRLLVGAGYGYLPESVNGAEVHSILIKTSYSFSKGMVYKRAKWYAGFNTIYGITDNTFLKLPSRYPDKYYAPNAIHFSPYLGLSMPLSFYKPMWAKKANFNIELGTLDSYLWYHILNSKIGFWDVCNLSYGIYYDF